MKDSENVREEIATILVLILTLAFTSSNLTPEVFDKTSSVERLPLMEANN
ncbi:MAG: hypothetical protein ACFB4I_13680 [Cyanophyceae cyanobacterium]